MKPTPKPTVLAYPLARRMTLVVILGSLLFTLLSAAVQLFLDYRREVSLLDERLQQIRIIELPSLANSVWHFDDKQIDTQLQGMLNIQDVRYLELKIVDEAPHTIGRQPLASAAISRNFVLSYTQKGESFIIGQLQVVADRRSLQQRVLGRLAGILLAAALQIFLLAAFILLIVERLITRPLNEIARYAGALDLEHLEEPLVLRDRRSLASTKDELDLLALKINEMRRRLGQDITERKQMETALRESERNYRKIFNATSEAILIHEASSGRILQVNNSMLNMYGYASEAQILGKTPQDLSSDQPPYTLLDARLQFQKAQQEGPQVFEWQARKSTGEIFWVEVSLRSSALGGENRILAVVRDISDRKSAEDLLIAQNEALRLQQRALEEAETRTRQLNTGLEKRVAERTAQLASLNQELEAFSYSVAHDLRAPLRHMDGFSRIILDDFAEQLSDELKNRIQRIRDSSQSMAGMVDALLALSRLSRDEIHYSQVDLSALAHAVAGDLRQSEPDRQVGFEIQPGLSIRADERLLRIVLENLLGNAWKFTARRQSPFIELGCQPEAETENGRVFFVRDNGAGFNMAYMDRLFGPFQRLHTAAEFSGTGIGLATVKRIIQRHGGRVWAEAAVDQGATFFFSLP